MAKPSSRHIELYWPTSSDLVQALKAQQRDELSLNSPCQLPRMHYSDICLGLKSTTAISGAFNSLFKVLFIFPSRYLSSIGLEKISSFRRNIPPDWRSHPRERDSWSVGIMKDGTRWTGFSPFAMFFPRNIRGRTLWPHTATNQKGIDCKLFPVHSPLLRKSRSVCFPSTYLYA